jgi:hypothetical protein
MTRRDVLSYRARLGEGLEALPALLVLARQVVLKTFEPGDPDGDELRELLESSVVAAYRLRLRERLRAECDRS